MEQTWQSYEEVATYLLDKFASEFGLICVEGKQVVPGLRSGSSWKIDAKGFRQDNIGFVIVECRRFTNARQSQEKIGGMAYRIWDSAAKGGILVSPLGLQSGAKRIAKAENIVSVTLDANSTPTEFTMQFLNKIFVGMEDRPYATDALDVSVITRCAQCNNEFIVKDNELICEFCLKDNSPL
ncbi:MAG TPA: hypothetical protein VLC98_11635 [Phnomibacter sp.]|nr:hypothetical protein [Phnomibacter sp.]